MGEKSEHEAERRQREHAYERMLERLRHFLEEADEQLHLSDALERARQRAIDYGELSREEADRIAGYVRRDLHDLGDYLVRGGHSLADWLRLDTALIEDRLLDTLDRVADRARIELAALRERSQSTASYQAGEIAGPGTLVCDGCGDTQSLRRGEEIPPCPRCQGRSFHRQRP